MCDDCMDTSGLFRPAVAAIRQTGCPHAEKRSFRTSSPGDRIKTTPKEAATSLRGLTKSIHVSTKTREVSMATDHGIGNTSFPESVVRLPPGYWRLSGGIRRFVRTRPRPIEQAPKVDGRTTRAPAACGTPSGWKRHRKNDENPCLDCRRAVADYRRELRARRRNEVAA